MGFFLAETLISLIYKISKTLKTNQGFKSTRTIYKTNLQIKSTKPSKTLKLVKHTG